MQSVTVSRFAAQLTLIGIAVGCRPAVVRPVLGADEAAPRAEAAPVDDERNRVAIAGDIGTSDPVRVEAYSPTGHWIVARQDRSERAPGRRPQPWDSVPFFLFDGPGPGTPIGTFADASDDGHWLAYADDGNLVLRDMWGGRSEILGPSYPDPSHAAWLPAPVVSFAGDNATIAFALERQGRVVVAVRDLESGVQHVVDPGQGTLVDAWLSDSGRVLGVAVNQTRDAAGAQVIPRLRRGDAHWPRPRGAPHVVWDSEVPTHRFARVGADTEANLVNGLLGLNDDVLLGDRIVGRRARKLVDRFGDEVIAPASCFAHIVGVSRELQRVWVVCLGTATELDDQTLPVSWYDMDGGSSTLPERIRFERGEATVVHGLLALEGERFLNLETGTVGPAACDPYAVAATHRDRVFCIEDDRAGFVYDLQSAERTALSDLPRPVEPAILARGAVFTTNTGRAGTMVVDMDEVSLRGVVPGFALGLSDSGQVLVADLPGGAQSWEPNGPLRWVDAKDYCIPSGASRAQLCTQPSIAQR